MERSATAMHYRRPGLLVSLYTPTLSRDRPRVELGFMVRVRDPRAPFLNRFDVAAKDKPRGHWRWLKVYVGWTNPGLVDERGKILVAEAETHLTNGALGRITTKTYARLKFAKGAPRAS
jgi:hypothetical protein